MSRWMDAVNQITENKVRLNFSNLSHQDPEKVKKKRFGVRVGEIFNFYNLFDLLVWSLNFEVFAVETLLKHNVKLM